MTSLMQTVGHKMAASIHDSVFCGLQKPIVNKREGQKWMKNWCLSTPPPPPPPPHTHTLDTPYLPPFLSVGLMLAFGFGSSFIERTRQRSCRWSRGLQHFLFSTVVKELRPSVRQRCLRFSVSVGVVQGRYWCCCQIASTQCSSALPEVQCQCRRGTGPGLMLCEAEQA